MESEEWSAKYQQTDADDGLNNGNIESLTQSNESLKNAGTSGAKKNTNGAENRMLDQKPISIAISEKSKQKIQLMLEQIRALDPVDRFLFFLKLHPEVSNIADPFRHQNPLGSRSEISKTISWIKTHLTEDPDISLPKQEVYDEYYQFCEKKCFKPLSQADFGKAMKQVYPNVRARRLGTRGNSRYCYSGLKRCSKLDTPCLPDLGDKPISTEPPFSRTITETAWQIVKEWSKQQLGEEFDNISALAEYLLVNQLICVGGDIAGQLTHCDSQRKDEINGKIDNKHREMQLQLQRKLQQKSEIKERKRKIQSPKVEQKAGKRGRALSLVPCSETSPMLAVSSVPSECSTSSCSTSPNPGGKSVCDKPLDYTQPSLPDFNSFQIKKPERILANRQTEKVAIPKLPIQGIQLSACGKKAKNEKYKAIQPKTECDIASYNRQNSFDEKHRSQKTDVHDIDRFKDIKDKKLISDYDCDGSDFPLPRERLNSISNVEKDAMDEYLGTNNSQHEEELSKYFNNNEVTDNDTTKLSHLRQLLEQTGIPDNKPSIPKIPIKNDVILRDLRFANPGLGNISIVPYNDPRAVLHLNSQVKRRVSFETPVHEDSVPPSPNTRRQKFNFTPISPGPQSPNLQSKCSSTSASPFVSPRNTPVPRSKNTTHQNAGIMIGNNIDVRKIKKELVEIPTLDAVGKNSMPMSAPPSPMLQKLLNTNKIGCKSIYSQNILTNDRSIEIGQLLANDIQNNIDVNFRSQSVPVNQMFIPQLAETSVTSEFSEIDPIPDSQQVNRIISSLSDQQGENNNIDIICNLANNPAEFGLHIINENLEGFSFSNPTSQIPCSRNMNRSQSIDVISYEPKGNPSRSVPSTPLPFTQTLKREVLNAGTRSYPSTPLSAGNGNFPYNINADCLLNGQPIISDGLTRDLDFTMTGSYSELTDDNNPDLNQEKGFNIEGHDYSNENSLIDFN